MFVACGGFSRLQIIIPNALVGQRAFGTKEPRSGRYEIDSNKSPQITVLILIMHAFTCHGVMSRLALIRGEKGSDYYIV